MSKVPKFLTKMISGAQDKYDAIKVLSHIPSMKARVNQAKLDLEALQANALAILEEVRSDYSDEIVLLVLTSKLSRSGGLEHFTFAQEIGMNYNSLLYFIKMRDFCLGGKWVNTQDRVIVMLAAGNEEMLTVLRCINLERLAMCPSHSE